MDKPALVLALLVFAAIGALPRIFFRRDGSLNLDWWLTALPFFAAPVLLVLSACHVFAAEEPRGWAGGLAIASVVPFFLSGSLLFYTLGTHKVRIALWHQENDAPVSIVTTGAYRLVRHPFYVSFLLGVLGTALLLPHWSTALILVYAVVRLNSTAAREERRLGQSRFGSEYRDYIAVTGRFVPRFGRPRVASPVSSPSEPGGARV
jgi:protein-S-isoprenylcysteine O-methyltransferase Ste14